MATAIVLGVYIPDRMELAGDVQQILTEYGCNVKTRLGLHQAGDGCESYGLILLELVGEEEQIEALEGALAALDDVQVKKMAFKL